MIDMTGMTVQERYEHLQKARRFSEKMKFDFEMKKLREEIKSLLIADIDEMSIDAVVDYFYDCIDYNFEYYWVLGISEYRTHEEFVKKHYNAIMKIVDEFDIEYYTYYNLACIALDYTSLSIRNEILEEISKQEKVSIKK